MPTVTTVAKPKMSLMCFMGFFAGGFVHSLFRVNRDEQESMTERFRVVRRHTGRHSDTSDLATIVDAVRGNEVQWGVRGYESIQVDHRAAVLPNEGRGLA